MLTALNFCVGRCVTLRLRRIALCTTYALALIGLILGAASKSFALESNKLQIEAGQEWLTMIQKTVSDRFTQMGYVDIEVPSLVSSPRWVACNVPVTKVRQINRPTGRVYLTLECLRPRWQSQTDVLVKAKRSVVVAQRSLSHNTLIEPNDVSLIEIDWTTVGDDVVTDIESVVGKTLGRSIALGQVLTLNSVRQTAVIRGGEVVRIEMVGPSFVIGGEGVALQQGTTGESIRIKMKSGQVVSAVVLRPGLVRVDLQ